MEEGYPGNVQAKVVYELNNQDQLVINYHADVDQRTPLALTNHTYFNLSGFEEKLDKHQAVILADSCLVKDSSDCVNGSIESTLGALDFKVMKPFSAALEKLSLGVDHYYIFHKPLWALEKVADFQDAKSGRSLEVYTTEPGMQFYTGYYISNLLSRENGHIYGPLSAFCCETQRYPNGVNIENSPESFADSNQPFESKTIYKFNYN
jgi:aldose 1-epimerase